MRKLTTKKDRNRALSLLQEMRRLTAKAPSPLRHMTKAEIIRHMRETRERLWEQKIASLGSRR